jgi:hypothetical protein
MLERGTAYLARVPCSAPYYWWGLSCSYIYFSVFTPDTQVSSANKTDNTEILLKVALSTNISYGKII